MSMTTEKGMLSYMIMYRRYDAKPSDTWKPAFVGDYYADKKEGFRIVDILNGAHKDTAEYKLFMVAEVKRS